MTYHNAVKYLLNAPDDSPEPIAGARLRRLWMLLGNPQRNIKYLRLAGSSGKTVCAEMLLSAFEGSDFRVGCLNMPVQTDPRENIRIGQKSLSFDGMAACVEQIYQTVKNENKRQGKKEPVEAEQSEDTPLTLTKHEILLSAALLAFRDNSCDLCIIETNNLANDPTRFLPHPLAAAVCGTIPKQGQRELQQIRSYICHGIQEIVSAPQDQEAYQIISKACATINCRLTIPTKAELRIQKCTLSGSEFTYRDQSYRLSLCGQFQITNAMVTLEILNMLARHGYTLSEEQIHQGLRTLKIPCKFEILSVMPTIIADSTHSVDAIEPVCQSMTELRPLIGNRITLCLPSAELAEQYLSVLREQDYEIQKIILQEQAPLSDDTIPVVYGTTLRQTVLSSLEDLGKDSILLLSGAFPFTNQIRYELLKTLGF